MIGRSMNSSSQYFSQQIAEARYYCPSKHDLKAPLTIVSAGWESCNPEYRINRRGFPWQAVELVVKGEGWLTLSKGKIRLRPGILFRYGHETTYEMVSDINHPLQKYFVDFTGREARQILSISQLQSGEVRQALYPNELGELFERILVEGNRKLNLSSAIAVNYLRLLFQKIEQCVGLAPGGGTSRSLAGYLRSKAFLDENYTRSSNIQEAADKLGMTPETLCRLFRRFSQVSPHQYLVELRINFAVDLLLGTDLLTKQIGQKVGYPDPFHFSRIFKRIQGVSPEVFRRLRRSMIQ
jgi:AraC family transcriptional regulator of arabinose operon